MREPRADGGPTGGIPPLLRFAEVRRADGMLLNNLSTTLPSLQFLLVTPDGAQAVQAIWNSLLNEEEKRAIKKQRVDQGPCSTSNVTGGSSFWSAVVGSQEQQQQWSRCTGAASRGSPVQPGSGQGGAGTAGRQTWEQRYGDALDFCQKHPFGMLSMHRLARNALVRKWAGDGFM